MIQKVANGKESISASLPTVVKVTSWQGLVDQEEI